MAGCPNLFLTFACDSVGSTVQNVSKSTSTLLTSKSSVNQCKLRIGKIVKTLTKFAAEKMLGSEKCPVYLKLPWISNVSSKFENQINKGITSCFYAVKPCVVYSKRVMLQSTKKMAFLQPKKVV